MHLRSLAALGILGVIAACADNQVAPRPSAATPEYAIQPMTCNVQIQAKSVACTPASAGGQPLTNRLLRNDLIVGGQHQYVTLTSSGIIIVGNIFAFNVTLTNLTPQPFGTRDGVTGDTAGIKVFLTGQPVTTGGSGNVTVSNASGTGTFTNSNQPFYQYKNNISEFNTTGILDSGQTTDPIQWQFTWDPGVTSFTFTAYVATPVPHPNGYIRGMPRELWMAPNATDFLSPTVYSAVGNVITGDTLVYSSYYPGVITATSDGTLTAGSSDTVTDITVADTSGNRIGLDTTSLVICSRMPTVTNGSAVQDTLFPNDCNHPIDNAQAGTGYRAKLYRLALNAGDSATISVNVSSGTLDSYLVLSDTVGNVLASNDDYSGLGSGSQVSYIAATTGIYIIQVSSYNWDGTGPSSVYTMNVSVVPFNLSQANLVPRLPVFHK